MNNPPTPYKVCYLEPELRFFSPQFIKLNFIYYKLTDLEILTVNNFLKIYLFTVRERRREGEREGEKH